jgi:hypothetical protein
LIAAERLKVGLVVQGLFRCEDSWVQSGRGKDGKGSSNFCEGIGEPPIGELSEQDTAADFLSDGIWTARRREGKGAIWFAPFFG